MEHINAPDFKAHCLAILDRVQQTGETITILKRGKRVAQLVPYSPREESSPQSTLAGTAKILGDIVASVVPAHEWEAAGEP